MGKYAREYRQTAASSGDEALVRRGAKAGSNRCKGPQISAAAAAARRSNRLELDLPPTKRSRFKPDVTTVLGRREREILDIVYRLGGVSVTSPSLGTVDRCLTPLLAKWRYRTRAMLSITVRHRDQNRRGNASLSKSWVRVSRDLMMSFRHCKNSARVSKFKTNG